MIAMGNSQYYAMFGRKSFKLVFSVWRKTLLFACLVKLQILHLAVKNVDFGRGR
jgi:hypothetical protein